MGRGLWHSHRIGISQPITFCTCLDTVLTLIEQCGEDNVGVNLDMFHWWKGPSKLEDLQRLTRTNLFTCNLPMWQGCRELATDSDRIMPGRGYLHLANSRLSAKNGV
jgi:hypothetical protein